LHGKQIIKVTNKNLDVSESMLTKMR